MLDLGGGDLRRKREKTETGEPLLTVAEPSEETVHHARNGIHGYQPLLRQQNPKHWCLMQCKRGERLKPQYH